MSVAENLPPIPTRSRGDREQWLGLTITHVRGGGLLDGTPSPDPSTRTKKKGDSPLD